ncbi:GGDEF domain-containing protein [Sphingomonas sp.]|uniref:GGDEF domain-containing protein n=1 Tax=Sphingomonas sp. TaxID=28214 RepID=UPI001B0E9BE6|nr:GGDEF domain-containing protein [Sphingomonas sp.]MBO9713148.1 GGDEF domain-containing protein [Sphingomonas sp.]
MKPLQFEGGEQADAGFGRRPRRLLAKARFEALLFVLLMLTVAAVACRDRILEQRIHLTPASLADGRYALLAFSDKANGGKSRAAAVAPLHWTCDTKPGFAYPYCGYEIFFDGRTGSHGIDLKNFRGLTIELAYRGPSKTIRLHLKNFDPRYATRADADTPKYNRIEFDAMPGRTQTQSFTISDFGVPDWWLRKRQLSPSLSHPQFDNVTSIDIETGTESTLGHHEFDVRGIVIRKALLSDAQWYLALLGFWVVLIGVYLAWRIGNLKGEVERTGALQQLAERQAEEAEETARRDPLTKVLNRRGVAERHAALSADGGIAALIIDIDHFKRLNDQFGHSYGDEVLIAVAALIRRNVRPADTVGRWGGEEFVVLCPGVDSIEAQHIAEKIRRRIEHFHFGDCEAVTASIGVHRTPAAGPDLAELVGFADVALYSAKASGRNCCRLYRAGMAKAA